MESRQAGYKLVLLGESAVGKSSIVLRFIKSQFHEYQEATIGAAYLTQSIVVGDPQVTVKFEIWDTAGQERYHSLAPMYYRGAQAAVVVYDITNQQSYERAVTWVSELREQAPGVKVIAFAGNKCDLHRERFVPTEVAEKYARDNGLIFLETSAKTAINVMELFTAVAESLSTCPELAPNGGGRRLEEAASPVGGSRCCK